MFDKLRMLFIRFREFFLYCFIGCSGVAIDFIVYYCLYTFMGMHYQLANVIGVTCGIGNNFVWNAVFNFKRTDRLLLRFLSFYSVGLLGLGISAALLYLFIECLSFNELISKLIIIFIVTVIQFTLNKVFTFRKVSH